MGGLKDIRTNKKIAGFTIVELLIVIVVIGILAVIVVVSYNGVAKRAIEAKVQSDAKNAQTELELRKVEFGVYPSNNKCPVTSTDDICLTASKGNTLTYIPSGDKLSYQLAIVNSDSVKPTSYLVSDTQELGLMLTWKQISAGDTHTCAISSDDYAYCWGDNAYGQLGDGSNVAKLNAVRVMASTNTSMAKVKSISAGKYYTCAVTASDSLAYCWGDNYYGQLGIGSKTPKSFPSAVVALSGVLDNAKSISAGTNHTCAIKNSGNQVYCWGDNTYGQLGNMTNTPNNYPVQVRISTNVYLIAPNSISVGTDHTCAINDANKAYCWGRSADGRLGIGNKQVNVCGLKNWKWVCWYEDLPGVPPNDSNYAVAVKYGDNSDGNFKSIASGDKHTCAIGLDNKSYCWGSNTNGQLGNVNSLLFSLTPKTVSQGELTAQNTISQISSMSGALHNCVISTQNKPFCWGSDNNGQLGSNSNLIGIDTNFALSPTSVNKDITDEAAINLSNKTITQISVGVGHTCAIDSNAWAYCWGLNSSGQLGSGSTNNSGYPIRVKLLKTST